LAAVVVHIARVSTASWSQQTSELASSNRENALSRISSQGLVEFFFAVTLAKQQVVDGPSISTSR